MSTTILADDPNSIVPRIPVGEWFNDLFDWITDNMSGFFDAISTFVDQVTNGLSDLLTTPAPLILAVIFALLAWWVRDWKFGIIAFVAMAFIISVAQWDNAMDTLALVVVAAAIALIIGIPLGILAARSSRFSSTVKPVMDLMQTMPAFVWLIPVVTLFGINVSAGVVATVIFCLPPGVRLTELGIRQVDPEVVEAGQAFGSSPGQILRGIQIPLATPTIMAGVNQVIMLALSMAVIAGLVGAGGLGGAVTTSIATLDLGLGFEAGLSVVALAIYLDRVTAGISERQGSNGGAIKRLKALNWGHRQNAASGGIGGGS